MVELLRWVFSKKYDDIYYILFINIVDKIAVFIILLQKQQMSLDYYENPE